MPSEICNCCGEDIGPGTWSCNNCGEEYPNREMVAGACEESGEGEDG